MVSLDQEKAFDRVSHEFMGRTMKVHGLGDDFYDVVTTIYRDIASIVLVNGWKNYPFPVHTSVFGRAV